MTLPKMPRRTKEQSIKRNATRRENSIRNRKAVFCLKHLKITKPEIYNEAVGIYEHVNSIYPTKHDLMRTTLYQKIINGEVVALRADNYNVQTPTSTYTTTNDRTASTSTATIDRTASTSTATIDRTASTSTATNDRTASTSTTTTARKSRTEVFPILEIPFIEVPQQDHLDDISCDEMEFLMNDLQQDPALQMFFNEVDVSSGESEPKTLGEEIDNIINAEFQKLNVELQALYGC